MLKSCRWSSCSLLFLNAPSVLIHCAAARLKGSKDGLAGGVLQDLVVEGSIVHRPGIAPTQLLQPDNVRLSELPLYCPQAYVQRPQVNKGLYADFSALQTQPYKVGDVGSCQDKYAPHPLPFLPWHRPHHS